MTVPVPADMVLLVSHRSLTSPSETLWALGRILRGMRLWAYGPCSVARGGGGLIFH